MSALVVTVLLILAVASILAAALRHQPQQETTMPSNVDRTTFPIGYDPDVQAPPMADQTFEDIGDRGSCTTRGRHEHHWSKIVDGDCEQIRLGIVVPVGPSGIVMLSEGSMEEILTAAGFERSDQ